MNATVKEQPAGTSRRFRFLGAYAYWISTILVVLNGFFSGLVDTFRVESAMNVIRHLGYPDYFAAMLGAAKILGAIVLLAPVPRWLREWTYAGFTFDVLAAVISIAAVRDPIGKLAIPLVFVALTQVSYWAWRSRIETVAYSQR